MSDMHAEDHDHAALIPDLPEDAPTFVSQHEEEES